MTNHTTLLKRLAAVFALAAFATILHANSAGGFTPDGPASEKVMRPAMELSASALTAPSSPKAPGDCPVEFEPNDAGAAAIAFPMMTGALNLVICPAADVDWFSVPMHAGEAHRIETYDIARETQIDTLVSVYSPDLLTLLASNDDRSGLLEPLSSMLVFTPLQSGTYYVKVAPFPASAGDESKQYTLRVTNQCSERYEPDNTIGQASAYTLGTISYRTLCTGGDQDWVSVSLGAGVPYRFETFAHGSTDTQLWLYDQDGVTELKTDDDTGIGFASLFF